MRNLNKHKKYISDLIQKQQKNHQQRLKLSRLNIIKSSVNFIKHKNEIVLVDRQLVQSYSLVSYTFANLSYDDISSIYPVMLVETEAQINEENLVYYFRPFWKEESGKITYYAIITAWSASWVSPPPTLVHSPVYVTFKLIVRNPKFWKTI